VPDTIPPQSNTPERKAQITAWVSIAAAALLIFTGYTTWRMAQSERELAVLAARAAREQGRSRALESEQQRYQQALAIVAAANTRHMQLLAMKKAAPPVPPVTAYWNPQMGLVLAADSLPAVPAGRTLQVWIIPRQGAPVSVGISRPDASGQMLMLIPPSAVMTTAQSLTITEEPAGGSPQPTAEPEWSGSI
jgi:anti-sigma-K factor RskA